MTASSSLLAWLSLIAIPTYSQFSTNCKWDDFVLSGAQGYEVQCFDGSSQYAYSPCMSYTLCNGVRYQSVLYSTSTGSCQFFLSQWDEGETAPIFRKNRDGDGVWSWTFEYTNGQPCNGGDRRFDIVWKCDTTAQPFSLQTECGQVDNNECHNEMKIKSVFACEEGEEALQASGSSRGSGGGAGGGSLVMILSFVALILYFVIGYIISVMRLEKEERDWTQVKQHFPQYEFWTYGLCAYTKAGCCVTYEWASDRVGKGGGAGTDETGDELLD